MGLVKLLETITLPSKRMERQTTPSIVGQTSLHKSLSPQKEKSRIAIKTTVPKCQLRINFTPNTCALAAEICLKICLFSFPQMLVFRLATTATCKVVSPSTLIGPFEFECTLTTQPSTGGKCTFLSGGGSRELGDTFEVGKLHFK